MSNRILYAFPERQQTRKGHFFVNGTKHREIVKDSEFEVLQEIDYDFPYLENYMICTIINNFYYEHHFTLNLN